MADDTYRLILKGEDSDLVKKIDETTAKLNKQRDLVTKFNRERASIAKADRREAFNSLSVEEKRVKLTRQQLDLERHLARARAQGNDTRVAALRLSMARNRVASAGLGSAVVSQSQGAGSTALGTLAALRGGPAGLAIAAVGGAIFKAASSALKFADEMSDMAEQVGISRAEMVQITRASGAAGVSVRHMLGGLSALEAQRSAALGGDAKAQALFARYGVDPSQGNSFEVARRIAGALGNGSLQTEDRGAMGQLFGRRPEAMLSMLRNVQEVDGGLENKIQRLDAANARIEQFWNKVNEVNATVFASILNAIDKYNEFSANPRTGAPGSMNGLDFVQSRLSKAPTSLSDAVAGPGMGRFRRSEDTVLGGGGFVSDPTFRTAVPAADALARMGLYIGGGPNSSNNIMRQQLAELKAIKDATRGNTQAIRNW